MLPLARELTKQGTAVVIAANSLPSINDVTAEELRTIIKQAGQLDKLLDRSLQEGTLQVVESGSDLPVIDLSKVAIFCAIPTPLTISAVGCLAKQCQVKPRQTSEVLVAM